MASNDKPVNSLQIFRISSLNVKGTKAGKVGITFKLNCLAISYPNLLAPILGMDKPPVAITKDLQEKICSEDLISYNPFKKLIFSIRSQKYTFKFPTEELKCICGINIDEQHLYECHQLNSYEIKVDFNKIYNGTCQEMKIIVERMKENFKKLKV